MTGFGPATDQVAADHAHRLTGDGYRIVDVREHDEFAAGHIVGALHIPLHQLPHRLHELDASARWLAICRSGARSMQATAFLRAQGLHALNVAGGMGDWLRVRLPVRDLHGLPGRVI